MALADICKKIIDEAASKKDEMESQARAKKMETLSMYKKKAEELAAGIIKKAEQEAMIYKKGVLIEARLQQKNAVLSKKRKLLEEVFEEAQKRFMESADYPKVVAMAVKKNAETKKELIMIGASESRLDAAWLESLNQEEGAGFAFDEKKGDFCGGVIIKNSDVSVNLTTGMLLDQLRASIEGNAAGMLF